MVFIPIDVMVVIKNGISTRLVSAWLVSKCDSKNDYLLCALNVVMAWVKGFGLAGGDFYGRMIQTMKIVFISISSVALSFLVEIWPFFLRRMIDMLRF